MQTEKSLQTKVTNFLKHFSPEIWFFKVHGGPFQKAGVPDIIGCCNSQFFGIELKREGKNATPLQAKVINDMCTAGAHCIVSDDFQIIACFIEDLIILSHKYLRERHNKHD